MLVLTALHTRVHFWAAAMLFKLPQVLRPRHWGEVPWFLVPSTQGASALKSRSSSASFFKAPHVPGAREWGNFPWCLGGKTWES